MACVSSTTIHQHKLNARSRHGWHDEESPGPKNVVMSMAGSAIVGLVLVLMGLVRHTSLFDAIPKSEQERP